ncbi:hypothetical protein [Moorella sulfitireducens (nom. illeg.)]|uniref:hypothetical protein n=1 Tax=Neomoorella sulfitireducens TaxID=2972948 RepID=UPI0021AD29BD|nr:hypothetical protein [Moorella sulfitireducens]
MTTNAGSGDTTKALRPPAARICAACRHYWGKKRGHCEIAGRGVNPYGAACWYFKEQRDKGEIRGRRNV